MYVHVVNGETVAIPRDDVPPAAILTELRSFVPSALQLPSKALTSLLTRIESAIAKRTKSNMVFGDLFWSIVEDLTKGSSLVEYVCFNYGAAIVYLCSAIFAVYVGLNPLKATTSLVSVALALVCMCLHFGHGVHWSRRGSAAAAYSGPLELTSNITTTTTL
ncbi:hypothetical protein HPB50_028680 [Hyalomma asiaticum]|nr:hypothetical protein HPB50_028680 [Hyalomma asiaticum]